NVSAEQSGFSRVAMFFTDSSGDSYVIDPMMDKGNGTANRIPIGDSLEYKMGMYCRKVNVGISNSNTLDLTSDYPMNLNIRPGGLCIVNEVLYRITSTNEHEIYVEGSLGADRIETVYFPIAQIIDNMSPEYVEKLSDRSNVFQYDGNNPANDKLKNGDGDQMIEGVTENGGVYSWNASINSKNLYDGNVKIWFVAFDAAGNYSSSFDVDDKQKIKSVLGSVANNPPRLEGIKFGCDINGDGNFDGEMNNDFSNKFPKGLSGEEFVSSMTNQTVFANVNFVIKNSIRLIPEVVGGNGELKYSLNIGDDVICSNQTLFETGSYDDTARAKAINVSYAKLIQRVPKNGSAVVTLTLTDSTEGGSKEAKYIFNTTLDIIDNESPKLTIKPLYWENVTKNSIYKDSNLNLMGHIDLSDDLYFTGNDLTQDSGVFDRDTKVSGIIIFEGTASDNFIVDEIKINIPHFKELSFTRNNGGLFDSTGDVSSVGWLFEPINSYDSNGRNVVDWKLYWDTNKITNHVQTDVNITFTV
ncbi:MAG: hypothetical protein J6W76_01220, partial [Spirochaetales bacterium]|nr:hypothetical protein [Spirochaetales bacterium]